MKNKKIMVVMLLTLILLTTGCGNKAYIKDEKNQIVIDEVTGQSLRTSIYCKPSKDTEIYKLYEKYENQMTIKLSKLPTCEKYKINSNKTKSLWQFLFVKPLAYVILKLGYLLKKVGMTKAYLGVSLMAIGLIIRLIILPFNIKTQKQSKNMQKAAPELQRLEKKYAGKTDQASLMAKQQEMMMIYQKYKVNPMLSCLLALIQLPLFFAFLQAIYKIPAIYEGEIFGWNLGTTPSVGIFKNHQYSFIILLVLIILSTYFSFNYSMNRSSNASLGADAASQMKTMLYVMTIFITLTSLSLPTAIALYWIVTYTFIIVQTYFMNRDSSNHKTNNRHKSDKSIKEKLKMKEGMKYGKNN